MTNHTFYVWARPAWFSNDAIFDHTFVTDYDIRLKKYLVLDIASVISNDLDFWYCHGNFCPNDNNRHNEQIRLLGKQSGNLSYAICLVDSNTYGGRGDGTIAYGASGVCHQIANQVLFATGSNRKKPLTVSNARGYWLSSFRYNDYCSKNFASIWEDQKKICSNDNGEPLMSPTPDEPDEFERHVFSVLGTKDEALAKKLIDYRNKALAYMQNHQNGNVKDINEMNQKLFDGCADILGDELYLKVFGYPARKRIDLVDPAAMSPTKIPVLN